MATGSREGAHSACRPSGMRKVGEKCWPLERATVPRDEPSFRESKEGKVTGRVVTDNEPWIQGRIWAIQTNGK